MPRRNSIYSSSLTLGRNMYNKRVYLPLPLHVTIVFVLVIVIITMTRIVVPSPSQGPSGFSPSFTGCLLASLDQQCTPVTLDAPISPPAAAALSTARPTLSYTFVLASAFASSSAPRPLRPLQRQVHQHPQRPHLQWPLHIRLLHAYAILPTAASSSSIQVYEPFQRLQCKPRGG